MNLVAVFIILLCGVVAGVIVVERHHHLRRELIAAIVLSSVASVVITIAALYAFFVWRRSRRALVDSKDTQSIGLGLTGSCFPWLTCCAAHVVM